jgi:hypothetical protein
MRSDVVQIAELAASGQNIHRQALSAKAKSATGSPGCGSFASGSVARHLCCLGHSEMIHFLDEKERRP